MSNKLQCWACGEGTLSRHKSSMVVEHDGCAGSILQFSHSCDACGAKLFNAEDVRDNKRSWIRFKKQSEMLPLGCEILSMRLACGLTQKQAGELFGGGPTAFSKYEADDLIPDEAMNGLLKMAIEFPDTVARLAHVRSRHVVIRQTMYEAESESVSETSWTDLIGSVRTGITVDVTSQRSLDLSQLQEPQWVLQ